MRNKNPKTMVALFLLAPLVANATVLSQLGDQDFADGTSPVFTSAFTGSAAGDPAPFNIFYGSDPGGTFGSLSYTHLFTAGTHAGASLVFGLVDHDSFSPEQNTVEIKFDGVVQDTTAIRGISIMNSSAHVVTFAVAASMLQDGMLTVNIRAIAAGTGSSGNGIGVDFSRLEVAAVPEPSTYALMALGLAGLAAAARRSRPA